MANEELDKSNGKNAKTKGTFMSILKHFGIHGTSAGIIATFVFSYLADQREATKAIQQDLTDLKAKIEIDDRQDKTIETLRSSMRRTTGALWEVNRAAREQRSANTVTSQTNERLIDHMYKHRLAKPPVSKTREGGMAEKIKNLWNGKKKKAVTARVPRKIDANDMRRQAEQNYMQQQAK